MGSEQTGTHPEWTLNGPGTDLEQVCNEYNLPQRADVDDQGLVHVTPISAREPYWELAMLSLELRASMG